jgi:hypothetical protein
VCHFNYFRTTKSISIFRTTSGKSSHKNSRGLREIRTSLLLVFANGLQFSWRNPLANTGDPGGALTSSHRHTNA